ncbi:ZC21B protein, partial [Sclerurus mexicanus]|nr:ZC21B protein [Sclerurus mexicanus]
VRHDPICKKVFNWKCKPFSILKQRLQGTEITTVKKQPPQKLLKESMIQDGWCINAPEDFVNTFQSAKQVTKALKEGHPLPPPPPPSINTDLWSALSYCYYVQCPYCSRRLSEAAVQRQMEFSEEQAVYRAAKTTEQALDKQPLTQRKTPTLTPAVLSLLERVQKGVNTDKPNPETSSEIPKKTGKSLGVSTGKNSSGKFG